MPGWLRRWWRHEALAPDPQINEARGDMQEEPPRDDRIDQLRQQLRQAHAKLTTVQAEVKALQVDAGVIQRDYQAPRRIQADQNQGHQPT